MEMLCHGRTFLYFFVIVTCALQISEGFFLHILKNPGRNPKRPYSSKPTYNKPSNNYNTHVHTSSCGWKPYYGPQYHKRVPKPVALLLNGGYSNNNNNNIKAPTRKPRPLFYTARPTRPNILIDYEKPTYLRPRPSSRPVYRPRPQPSTPRPVVFPIDEYLDEYGPPKYEPPAPISVVNAPINNNYGSSSTFAKDSVNFFNSSSSHSRQNFTSSSTFEGGKGVEYISSVQLAGASKNPGYDVTVILPTSGGIKQKPTYNSEWKAYYPDQREISQSSTQYNTNSNSLVSTQSESITSSTSQGNYGGSQSSPTYFSNVKTPANGYTLIQPAVSKLPSYKPTSLSGNPQQSFTKNHQQSFNGNHQQSFNGNHQQSFGVNHQQSFSGNSGSFNTNTDLNSQSSITNNDSPSKWVVGPSNVKQITTKRPTQFFVVNSQISDGKEGYTSVKQISSNRPTQLPASSFALSQKEVQSDYSSPPTGSTTTSFVRNRQKVNNANFIYTNKKENPTPSTVYVGQPQILKGSTDYSNTLLQIQKNKQIPKSFPSKGNTGFLQTINIPKNRPTSSSSFAVNQLKISSGQSSFQNVKQSTQSINTQYGAPSTTSYSSGSISQNQKTSLNNQSKKTPILLDGEQLVVPQYRAPSYKPTASSYANKDEKKESFNSISTKEIEQGESDEYGSPDYRPSPPLSSNSEEDLNKFYKNQETNYVSEQGQGSTNRPIILANSDQGSQGGTIIINSIKTLQTQYRRPNPKPFSSISPSSSLFPTRNDPKPTSGVSSFTNKNVESHGFSNIFTTNSVTSNFKPQSPSSSTKGNTRLVSNGYASPDYKPPPPLTSYGTTSFYDLSAKDREPIEFPNKTDDPRKTVQTSIVIDPVVPNGSDAVNNNRYKTNQGGRGQSQGNSFFFSQNNPVKAPSTSYGPPDFNPPPPISYIPDIITDPPLLVTHFPTLPAPIEEKNSNSSEDANVSTEDYDVTIPDGEPSSIGDGWIPMNIPTKTELLENGLTDNKKKHSTTTSSAFTSTTVYLIVDKDKILTKPESLNLESGIKVTNSDEEATELTIEDEPPATTIRFPIEDIVDLQTTTPGNLKLQVYSTSQPPTTLKAITSTTTSKNKVAAPKTSSSKEEVEEDRKAKDYPYPNVSSRIEGSPNWPWKSMRGKTLMPDIHSLTTIADLRGTWFQRPSEGGLRSAKEFQVLTSFLMNGTQVEYEDYPLYDDDDDDEEDYSNSAEEEIEETQDPEDEKSTTKPKNLVVFYPLKGRPFLSFVPKYEFADIAA